jgi:predicted GH43/DUF377 family glycosyl hydrolase
MRTEIYKYPIKLKADPSRVITLPSEYPGLARVKRIYERIAATETNATISLLNELEDDFGGRHKNLHEIFISNYDYFKEEYRSYPELSDPKKLLLGATLTKEYSIQSAALFNPSIVLHPDQSGLSPHQKRFIMSLRSTGEGHISSIEFRTGIVDNKGNLELDPLSKYSLKGKVQDVNNETDYTVIFPTDSELSERVLFPQAEIESMGMEDLRLVAFSGEYQSSYYGTYTAYNGREIRSQILETRDFKMFTIRALKGSSAKDKGMALFPEKIKGKYAMVSRQGGENISIMFSENLYQWDNHHLLMEPVYPFEYSQIGNCGSPIKTDKGWLLLTHGVGPMRHYTISAALLDLEDPEMVIARLDRPLVQAEKEEREGYVPNVVYTCGALAVGDKLIIPYAMSDSMSGFCSVNINDLLLELTELA